MNVMVGDSQFTEMSICPQLSTGSSDLSFFAFVLLMFSFLVDLIKSLKGYKCVKSLFEGVCGEVAVNQYLAHIQLLSYIQRLKRILKVMEDFEAVVNM